MTRAATVSVILAVVLFAWPSRASAQLDPQQLAEFKKKRDAAIDDGVTWLKLKQITKGDEEGSWGIGKNPLYGGGGGPEHDEHIGITALSLLALLKSDVPPQDPVIQKGFEYIKKHIDPSFPTSNVNLNTKVCQLDTYDTAALLMAIEAYADGLIDEPYVKAKKDKPTKNRPAPVPADKDQATWAKNGAKWLQETQSSKGGWRYGEPLMPSPSGISMDSSATQMALLGLASADRMGMKVDTKIWEKAANYALDAQQKDGPPIKLPAQQGGSDQKDGKTVLMKEGDKARGWAYVQSGNDQHELQVNGGMTCCGICSLILCKAELKKGGFLQPDMGKRLDRGVFDGLAWMTNNWSVTANPGGWRSHYYYLYGLERVGVLSDTKEIGGHNWQIEGDQFLIDAQRLEAGKDAKKDGRYWDGGDEVNPKDVIDSCFALLFLKRGTVPIGSIISREK